MTLDSISHQLPPDITDSRNEFALRCLSLASSHQLNDVSHYFRGINLSGSAQLTGTGVDKQPGPTIMVPGLSGDTVSALVGPFMCARDEIAVRGYTTQVVWLNGRTGCDDNAATLRDSVLEAANSYSSKVNLIGYSKGCADSLHMIANYPETHECIASLVSLGGIVWGSKLADSTPTLIRKVVQYIPLPGSAFGDGKAIRDLSCRFRKEWMHKTQLPSTIHYATIAAVPTPDRVSRVLRGTYRKLSSHSVHNDSQVIYNDTLLPNSELLATVNADHWAIALPFSRRWTAPVTGLLIDQNDFPRTLLLQAIIDHVTERCV